MAIENPIPFDLILSSDNLVEELSEDDRKEIGSNVVTRYEEDLGSKSEWLERAKDTIDLAKQVRKEKNEPVVENYANAKYPAIAIAATGFAARAFPALVPTGGTEIVRPKVIGGDPTGEKLAVAKRRAEYLNYQLTSEIDGWVEGMDNLLHMLPIVGKVWKKIYFDTNKQKVASEVLLYDELIFHQDAKFNRGTYCYTHKQIYTTNEIVERMRGDIWYEDITLKDEIDQAIKENDGDKASFERTVLEQHTLLDLDGDGYLEPYIVVVDLDTKALLRVRRRFEDVNSLKKGFNPLKIKSTQKGVDIVRNDKKEIVRIEAIEYFQDYVFMPSFDGSLEGTGYNVTMAGLNDTIESILNRLLDSGTLHNLQTWLAGRGVKMKGGETRIKQGRINVVDVDGGTLRENIIPFPTKEPSMVLFSLLGLMIDVTEKVGSSTDVATGSMPSPDAAEGTVMALIEQGQAVFKGIYKRIRLSMDGEISKISRLNRIYLNPEHYYSVVEDDRKVLQDDFKGETDDFDLTADPTVVTNAEKLMKVKAQMELVAMPGSGLSMKKLIRRGLEAIGTDNIEELEDTEPPPPNEVLMLKMAELENEKHLSTIKQQEVEIKHRKMVMDGVKQRTEVMKMQAEIMKLLADTEAVEDGIQMGRYRQQLEEIYKQNEMWVEQTKLMEERNQSNGVNSGRDQEMAGQPNNTGDMGTPPQA